MFVFSNFNNDILNVFFIGTTSLEPGRPDPAERRAQHNGQTLPRPPGQDMTDCCIRGRKNQNRNKNSLPSYFSLFWRL